jgi:hypothetical protein
MRVTALGLLLAMSVFNGCTNSSGGGAGSSTGTTRTTEQTPKSPPVEPTAVTGTLGNSQVSLAWNAPSRDGGNAITDYIIQQSSDNGMSWTTFSDGTSTSTTTTVTGLTNGTEYLFRVAAKNSLGTGSYSANSASLTPRTVPGAPSLNGSAGLSKVNLSWGTPANNGSPVTDYLVEYGTGGTWTIFNDGESASIGTTVTGLINGTQYTFRVRAVNAAGTSNYSSTVYFTPQIEAPGVPTNIEVTAGYTEVSIVWRAPASDGGTSITDYIIQYSSDKGSSWSTFPDSKSTSLSIAVTGLSSCKGYVFRVAAKNSVGTGSYSTQSSPVALTSTCGLFEGVSTSYSVQPNLVQGWALNFQDASRPAQVELRIDNTVVGTMNTGRSRMDVVTYFQNTFNIPVNANSGYSFQIPDSYLDSRPHTVSVFAVSSQGVKTELGQSPRTFTFFRLREILAQPEVDTLTTNLLAKPWWNPGRPNVPFGYAFIPDYPGQVPPDKTFYVTINNPSSEFNPPATRAQEAFFSNDLFSTTGFSSVNPLKSQFSLSQVDFNNFSLNGVQVEKNRIGFWSSTRSFLPSCSPDLAGNCTQKGQFVMAASYNFGHFENSWSRPKPWQTGVSEGVIVSVDLKVPKALATNDINQDGSWKSAAFVNANFLLRDIKTDKKFWYSQSIFDCRGAVPNFLLDLVMQDECPNGLCLGIPIILSSIARQRTDTRRFSRTLSESTLYPTGTWNDSYRSFSYEINASHLNQALTEIRLHDSSWRNTVAKDIEIEHFNFSPELSRGTSDNAEIGMSFQNLRVHEVLSACQPGQISAPLTCNTMVLINHQWVWKLGTQTRTCSSNGRWEPPTNCQ